MKRLLKADFYHLRKSRLAFIALILALAFPVLVVLLYAGLNAIAGIDEEIPGATLFSANTVSRRVICYRLYAVITAHSKRLRVSPLWSKNRYVMYFPRSVRINRLLLRLYCTITV